MKIGDEVCYTMTELVWQPSAKGVFSSLRGSKGKWADVLCYPRLRGTVTGLREAAVRVAWETIPEYWHPVQYIDLA
jgi:hypothetical protein